MDNNEGKGIRAMYEPTVVNERDVRESFFVTPSGRQFLALREVVEPAGSASPAAA